MVLCCQNQVLSCWLTPAVRLMPRISIGIPLAHLGIMDRHNELSRYRDSKAADQKSAGRQQIEQLTGSHTPAGASVAGTQYGERCMACGPARGMDLTGLLHRFILQRAVEA